MKQDINDAMAHAAAIAICAERTNGTIAWEDAEEDLKSECLKDAVAALRAVDDCAAAISGDISASPNADICRYAESGWLIENGPASSPRYWGLEEYESDVLGWTPDHSRALRFARKVDAERYAKDLGWNDVRACEHIWDGARIVTNCVRQLEEDRNDAIARMVATERRYNTAKKQADGFARFTDYRCIPSQAVEAALDELRGYSDPSESRMADALAAAVRVLLTKVDMDQAIAMAIAENAS